MTGKKKVKKEKEERTCQYEMQEEEPCGRELYDNEHCIFHSKDIEGKKDKFGNEFWKDEFEKQKKNKKEYDFTGFVFPGDISFKGKEFEKSATFFDAQFSGKVDFRDAQFSKADFEFAQFSGVAIFVNAQFSEANFWEAKFSRMAIFGNAIFTEAYFRGAQFSGEAVFRGATFLLKANFRDAQFSGKGDLRGATFLLEANFNNAKFKEDAYFEGITIKKYSSFEMIDTYFYNVSGLFEYIEENDKFFNKHRKRSATLKTEFLPKNFKLILGDRIMARYPVQSRQIRDDMYLLDKKERISKMGGIRKYKNKTLYFLWWLFANYGRSFKRWARWSAFFALTFAIIFNCFHLSDPNTFQSVYINQDCSFLSFLYYSIVTFTTLGFGDIVPKTDWLQFWVALEVIMGYIMLGGLISILANKLARRS